MILPKLKIKIKENKNGGSLDRPRYSLSYGPCSGDGEIREACYEILSALKEDRDSLLEVNSSLSSIPLSQRESAVAQFVEGLRALGIEYRCRKVPSSTAPSLFSTFVNRGKAPLVQEVIAYIPASIWTSRAFYDILPLFGARYYVLPEAREPQDALDSMNQLLDEEKVEPFDLVVFDSGILGNMGISSSRLKAEELKQRLEM